MTIHPLLLIIFTILALSAGQIFFKLASEKIDIQDNGIFESFFLNPSLLIGLLIYGIATISWLLVLKTTPLKVAYPFAALSYFIVPILAFIFLGETIRWTTFAGAAVIILGVYISLL